MDRHDIRRTLLTEARRQGLSYRAVAARASVSISQVSRYLGGQSDTSTEGLCRMAAALGLSVEIVGHGPSPSAAPDSRIQAEAVSDVSST